MPYAPPTIRGPQSARVERPTAHARGYGKSWRQLRALVLSEEPLCRECLLERAFFADDPETVIQEIAEDWRIPIESVRASFRSMQIRNCKPLVATTQPERSTDCDHIKPRNMGGSDDRVNLQGLGHRHHSRKTAVESSGWSK